MNERQACVFFTIYILRGLSWDIACLMNITKWASSILVAKTHMNIRRLDFLAKDEANELYRSDFFKTSVSQRKGKTNDFDR